MFKFQALKLAKKHVPLSTHYIWVDIGLSFAVRNRGNFETDLTTIMNKPNEKISCCYIHYRNKNELYPMTKYLFGGGRCAIASGLISVQTDFVECLYNEMFRILYEQISLGIGHAEEQILVYVYDQHPEWFNIYYGDYGSLLTNYHRSVEDIQCIQNNFISNAKHAGKLDLVQHALNSLKY